MGTIFGRGARVRHPELGVGTVRAAGVAAPMLRVHFDLTGTDELVPVSTLIEDGGGTPSVVERAAPSPLPASVAAVDEATRTRRVLLECLRQGLPPPGGLPEWTVGFRKARRSVEDALARAKHGAGTIVLARAAYGGGKTHLSRLGAELAAADGFVTMHVELDGFGLSLASGHRVLAALLGSLQLPGSLGSEDHLVPGLGKLLERAARLRGGIGNPALDTFAPFLTHASKWLDSEEAIEVLERYLAGDLNRADASTALVSLVGTYIPLPSLRMSYGTRRERKAAQAAQLTRVVALALAIGCRGAFVTIDELDHDLASRDVRVHESLRELGRITANCPVVIVLLGRESTDLEIEGAVDVRIEPLSEEDLARLVDRTVDAFAAVYPEPGLVEGRPELIRKLHCLYAKDYARGGWGPRFFVRAAVEACEVVRINRVASLADVPV
jgi:bacteriophage exclusion system BrxC/D-like protein